MFICVCFFCVLFVILRPTFIEFVRCNVYVFICGWICVSALPDFSFGFCMLRCDDILAKEESFADELCFKMFQFVF